MRKEIKAVLAALAVILCFALVSGALITVMLSASHDCAGEDCLTCLYISSQKSNSFLALFAAAVFFAVTTSPLLGKLLCRILQRYLGILVFLKVKLSN